MPQIRNPRFNGSQPNEGSDAESGDEDDDPEFKLYKQIVYHKILAYIFRHCKAPSHIGYCMQCGDTYTRILYPCVLIKVVDGEEASILNAVRSATSHYPCPQCLAFKDDLANLSNVGPLRDDESMKAVYEQAKAAKGKTERERILQKHGLHLVKVASFSAHIRAHPLQNFLWDFGHTKTYGSNGYEKLHSDDGGKNGHHLWPLVRDTVCKINEAEFNENMGKFPPWPNLEKFDPTKKPASMIDFSDGNTFLALLKVCHAFRSCRC